MYISHADLIIVVLEVDLYIRHVFRIMDGIASFDSIDRYAFCLVWKEHPLYDFYCFLQSSFTVAIILTKVNSEKGLQK